MKCGQTRHSPSKPPTLSASLSLSSRLTGCPCFIQPATVCRPQGNERRRGRPVSRSQDGADAGRAWRGAPGGRLLGTPHLGAVCMASTPTGVFHLGLGPQAGPSFAQQRAPAAGSSQASWPLDTRPSGLCFNAPSSRKSPQTKPGTLASPAPEGLLSHCSCHYCHSVATRVDACVLSASSSIPPRGTDCDSVQWPLLNGRKKVNVQQTCPAHP